MKYYVVAKGRKPGIYLTWNECKEQVEGCGGAKFKSFTSVDEAEFYYAQYNEGRLPKNRKYSNEQYISKRSADQKYKNIDVCVLCSRPFKQQKTKNGRRAQGLCMSCKAKQHKIRSSLKYVTAGKVAWLSANQLLYIKLTYKCDDVFSFVLQHPDAIFAAKEKAESGLILKTLLDGRKSYYAESREEVSPIYVRSLLGESKEFIKVTGDKRDPLITFHCKRCNQDYSVRYRNLVNHKGHDCTALLSSGEAIVKDFLDKIHAKYLTQRDTLKCINPDTGYVMPYDFELPDQKIIIEVQGEQHRSFIEYFHVDLEGFHYRQEKDAYKKRFAEENGYTVIDIWYSDLDSGQYRTIISRYLQGKDNS